MKRLRHAPSALVFAALLSNVAGCGGGMSPAQYFKGIRGQP